MSASEAALASADALRVRMPVARASPAPAPAAAAAVTATPVPASSPAPADDNDDDDDGAKALAAGAGTPVVGGGGGGGGMQLTAAQQQRLEALRAMAVWLDDAWSVQLPVVGRVSFGADSLLGLVPGLGDVAGALMSLGAVAYAVSIGVSVFGIGQMLFHLVLDLVLGSVPLFGDFFDAKFKANKLNLRIIERHIAGTGHGPTLPTWLELLYGAFILVFVALVLLVVWVWVRVWLWCAGVWWRWFVAPFVHFIFGF